MAGTASSGDSSSDTIGHTVPGSSRIVAVFSIIPVLLVIVGLLFHYCLSRLWRKGAKRRQRPSKPRWKPLSLRVPTLLLHLALTLSLIILLESASLALPGSKTVQTDDTTDNLASTPTALTFIPAPTSFASAANPDVTLPSLTERGDGPTAPAPGIGWLSLGEDGWLSPQTSYFIGTFLPTLVASLFSILWKVLDTETKSLEPFAQLATPGGGPASETILLRYSGVHGFFSAIAGLFTGHSAVALSTFLMYSSALLVPLAAEAVHLRLKGGCLQDWTQHCTAGLQASDPVIRVAQALLALMACFIIAYMLLMRRRSLGVSSDPRSILGIACLAINPYLSALMRRLPTGPDGMFSLDEADSTLRNHKFEFGRVTFLSGQQEYGIIVTNSGTQNVPLLAEPESTKVNNSQPSRRSVLLRALTVFSFVIFIIGLCVLILYYRLTDADTGFERFMDSQSTFGVRFLFTVFGVIVGFGWAAIFQELATILPAWEMSQRPIRAEHSIMMPLSPSPYQGVIVYLRHGHKLLALVSLVTILSDFLPIALANIPFNNAITWATFDVCTWVSVGVLSFMIVVLIIVAVAILRKSSRVLSPLGSESWGMLATVLYLVCHSEDFLAQLHGLSLAQKIEVKRRVTALNAEYYITRAPYEGQSGSLIIQILAGD